MKTPRSVFISRAALLTVTLAAISSCGPKVKTSASRSLVVTIHPLAAILREIVGGKFEIVTLVPPGASPHTFDPRPSEARAVESAQAFFWIDPNLDGWAAKLDCPKKFAMMDLLPGEFRVFIPESESLDPHFWTDPLAVKAVLPSLLKIVVECDPEGRQSYEANAARFAADLDRLNQQVQARLSGVTSRTVVLFHPSFRYLLRRYGLEYGGAIEDSPGKEPTPRYLSELAGRMKRQGVRVVFTEPQLPRGPAEALAEAAGAKIAELDPNGGMEGRRAYSDLILYNANSLAEALK